MEIILFIVLIVLSLIALAISLIELALFNAFVLLVSIFKSVKKAWND